MFVVLISVLIIRYWLIRITFFSFVRFKNVMFEITPGQEVGDFDIKAKFLGVEMEKVQLHFQVNLSCLNYKMPCKKLRSIEGLSRLYKEQELDVVVEIMVRLQTLAQHQKVLWIFSTNSLHVQKLHVHF